MLRMEIISMDGPSAESRLITSRQDELCLSSVNSSEEKKLSPVCTSVLASAWRAPAVCRRTRQ
jgi:hypothetical protein